MIRCFYLLFLCTPFVLGGFPYIIPTIGRPWPLPQSELPGDGSTTFDMTSFSFVATGNDCDILQNAFQRYQDILSKTVKTTFYRKSSQRDSNEIKPFAAFSSLEVNVMTECEDYPHMYMDEQYELKICANDAPDEATLVSQSIWGALRGLETFSQILVAQSDPNTFLVNCTQILDFPRFSHRGIMLETSRHYLPLDKIIENLDLMAMNKFNVFHWHIVDDQSFPYESTMYPDLTLGAWSPIHIYTPENISAVVEYAKNLGIRTVVEFDTPGHTLSWGVGQEGLLTPCYTDGVPDGTFGPIDPSKEKNFVFLQNLFTEISSRYPDHYLHLGGDEVPFVCWASNPDITDFMAAQNISGDYAKLEQYYITRLLDIVKNLPNANGYIIWEEVFDNGVEIANDTVVHVWKYGDPKYYREIASVTAAGYQALLSSCWYLNDINYGVDWHQYYACDPQGFDGTDQQKQLVMGGEACMWAEYVDETNVISRMWPRAAPVGERLWSDASATQDPNDATPRLEEHRCRLLSRGYGVEPFGPSFCEGVL